MAIYAYVKKMQVLNAIKNVIEQVDAYSSMSPSEKRITKYFLNKAVTYVDNLKWITKKPL